MGEKLFSQKKTGPGSWKNYTGRGSSNIIRKPPRQSQREGKGTEKRGVRGIKGERGEVGGDSPEKTVRGTKKKLDLSLKRKKLKNAHDEKGKNGAGKVGGPGPRRAKKAL